MYTGTRRRTNCTRCGGHALIMYNTNNTEVPYDSMEATKGHPCPNCNTYKPTKDTERHETD